MAQLVHQKMFICGDYAEHYRYEKPFWLGFPQIRRYKPKILRKPIYSVRVRDDNVRRTKAKIRRLVDCNANLDKFVLLTFNRPVLALFEANKIFKDFVLRITRQYPDFQYVCVPEFQPTSKRVHFHLLCNLPWIENVRLESIWNNGFVGVSYVRERSRVGSYIAKYISEDFFDERYRGKKKFFYSRSLIKPQVIYAEDCDKFFKDISFDFEKIDLFKNQFETDYCGLIEYTRSHLKKIDIIGP